MRLATLSGLDDHVIALANERQGRPGKTVSAGRAAIPGLSKQGPRAPFGVDAITIRSSRCSQARVLGAVYGASMKQHNGTGVNGTREFAGVTVNSQATRLTPRHSANSPAFSGWTLGHSFTQADFLS